MRLNPISASVTLFTLLQAVALPHAVAQAPEAASGGAVETMPDGNLRDPVPSPEVMKAFLAKTQEDLVFLKGGTFDMGDWGAEVNKGGLPFDGTPDSKPLHKVTLDSFSIGKYPVTYAEFDVFTAALRLPRINQNSVVEKYRKANNPAGVTWEGAKEYCAWLGKQAGQSFDLPTEAQWEYAARSGGKRFVYPTDDGTSDPGRNLPSFDQSKAAGGLVPVSSFPPNPAGIYYMSAGIHEWVLDWYDAKYYSNSPSKNPIGPPTGETHVVRGFFGSDSSAMTFKRWTSTPRKSTGTWTLYPQSKQEHTREIPITAYSNRVSESFRCVRLEQSAENNRANVRQR